MVLRLGKIIAAVSTAALALVGVTSQIAARADGAAPPATGLLAYGNANLSAANPSQYDTIVINADQNGQIPALRAANPNVRILIYKNVADTVSFDVTNGVDNKYLPDGMGYIWTQQNHPDWFLRDTNGNPVQWADYSGHWWMDVGNAAYQNLWAQNVISEVKGYGADGVMMDDVNANLGGHLPSGSTLAKYPTDSSYAAATESFLANVGPKIHAAGLLGIANIAFRWTTDWETMYKRWIGYVDGRLMEFWVKPGWNSTYARYGDNDWDYQMQQAADVLNAGKVFIPLTYGDMSDVTTQSYARASFLMAWNGGSSTEMWVPSTSATNPWSPAWTATIGTPTTARTQLANGVWQRSYSQGLVLVNSSRTATRTVTLPAAMLNSAGTLVSSVTMAPMTGAVLGASATPTASPTATPSPSPIATKPVKKHGSGAVRLRLAQRLQVLTLRPTGLHPTPTLTTWRPGAWRHYLSRAL